MALFLRGDIWWMEYRTRKVRVVKSTGLRKSERAKAEAVWQAWRLAFGTKPKRSIVEGLLDAVYNREERSGPSSAFLQANGRCPGAAPATVKELCDSWVLKPHPRRLTAHPQSGKLPRIVPYHLSICKRGTIIKS